MDTYVNVPPVSETEALRQRFINYLMGEAAKATQLAALEPHKPTKMELGIRAKTFEEAAKVWSAVMLQAPTRSKAQRTLNGKALSCGEQQEHRVEFTLINSKRHYRTLCGQSVSAKEVRTIFGSHAPACIGCRAVTNQVPKTFKLG